ncbi:pupal cuticle protein-like [Condylostylus longicornis]|uniref:pupal cuticle protein-like n=1 Tax=Condylostylus longicornis TaxID=2530218 RepID=UPI00244DD13A|nr:pupal cuticle protein-like [Condylostylus longicornis]
MKLFIVLAIIAIAAARSHVRNQLPADNGDILSKSYDLKDDGSYGWEYETANGISASENGVGGQYAKGTVEWTSPEGEHIILQYTADENGYQPSGSHVPQAPEYIARALAWIRAHPSVYRN